MVEETGYIAGKFEKIGSFYLTPGYANEWIYIYVAKELTYDKSNPDNDEFLNVKAYDYETLLQMVMNNEIKDAKTVISILFAKEYLKRWYYGKELQNYYQTFRNWLSCDL